MSRTAGVIPGPEIGFEMIASLIWMLNSVGRDTLIYSGVGFKVRVCGWCFKEEACYNG
jgi:hypothetical protein